MKYADLTTLDPAQTLALVEKRVRARRAGEVADMRLALQWCALHSEDPQGWPGAVPRSRGGDYLRQIGGEGTPLVADLCTAELAIAREAGEITTSNYVADCLDLEHRLPEFWTLVKQLLVEPWVARKIARMSRKLPQVRVGLVDAAMAAAIHESPGRMIEIAEAKIIQADPEAYRTKLEEDAKKTGVWLSRVRPGDLIDDDTGEPATRRIGAKLDAGAAVRCDENIDDLAEAIYDNTPPDADGNRPSHAQCRTHAFEMLVSEPHQAAAFLSSQDPDPTAEPAPEIPKPKKNRRPAEVVVHLSATVLAGEVDGVARVEGIGPMLLEQLNELLDRRDVHLQPVVDLNHVAAVNGYEHPTAMRKRTLLRTGGDVFPHTTSRTQRLDHDHPTPYDPAGPPGQTSDLNNAPLIRRHHRAKTHLGYQCQQIGLGTYRWTTPHGLVRIVTPNGTRQAPEADPDG